MNAWFQAAQPGAVLGCGLRDQNRADLTAQLDCLSQRHAILSGPSGLRAAGAAPWVLCQSSGSSGRAKTIRRSQASWIASFRISQDRFGLGAADRYAVLGHLGHSLSLYAATEALHMGASLLVLSGDNPRAQIAQMAAQRITVMYATPTQLRRLHMAAQGARLPAMTHVFCGGGKLDPQCRQDMAALCPNARIREFYGAAETSFIAIADADTPPGSVGRAYPQVRLRLDGDGRIWIASPYLFDGYLEPDLPDLLRDGDFVSTGDIGHLDDDGHLFLRGRASRMVTVADQNLFLEDVEAVLSAQGAGMSAALALPDPRRGHAVLAVIEGAPDDRLTARLRRACRSELGAHAVPRWVRFLPQLPLLASGKADFVALADQFGPRPA